MSYGHRHISMRRALCILLLLVAGGVANAQRAPYVGERQPRILLLVDASSSMLQPWGTKATRFQTAGSIITTLMDSIYAVNEGVEFGLRVYGHQSPAQNNDCYDSRQEVMFSKNNLTQMSLRLASLKPYGVSPIAYSLKEAAAGDLIDDARNAYSIILITDGGESCGGDICDVVKQLIERKIYFKPYIISLVDYAPLRKQYDCLGDYLQASKPEEIPVAIRTIVDAYRPLLSAPIMAVKVDPAPPKKADPIIPKKVDTQVIVVPRLLEPRMPDLRIALPQTRFHTSVARPQIRPMQLPELIAVSKPPEEPVVVIAPPVPAWKPERSVVPSLSAARSRPTPTAVVSDYRPQMRIMALSPVLVEKPAPAIPVWTPERSTVQALAMAQSRSNFLPNRFAPQIRPVAQPSLLAIAKPEAEWRPEHSTMQLIAMVQPRNNFQVGSYRPLLYRMAVPPAMAVSKPPVESPKRDTMMAMSAVLRPSSLPVAPFSGVVMARSNSAIRLPAIEATKRDTIIAVIPPTAPKADPPRTATPPVSTAAGSAITIKPIELPKPDPKAVTTPVAPPKPKETVFVKETEDAKETSVEVLFTDGRGKFYATSPQLQLVDAITGKLVKQFYRTVDANGNPDMQIVPAGTYNMLVAGRANMLMRRVVIEPNKKNKLTVRVSNGSLRFRYVDAEGSIISRPVTEYEARVNIRFEPGPTIRQRCTAELEYAPGNYYIEVNTIPIQRFNVDIDFGAITQLSLQQPGYLQFTNTSPKGRVSIFAPLGNQFVRVYDVNITGNAAAQRVMMRPGKYEIHWTKNPNMPYAAETVETFHIQMNAVTEIELR